MARIPEYVAQRSLDTAAGSMPNMRVNTAPFEAMQNLGGQLSAIGERMRQREQQREAFLAQQRFQQMGSAVEADVMSLQRDMDPTGKGFHDSAMELYQKRAQEFVASLPPELQEQWAERVETLRGDTSNRMAALELGQWDVYQTTETEKMLDQLAQGITQYGPGSMDGYIDRGEEIIRATNLPPIKKDELARAWREKAQVSALLTMSPQERKRALGETLGIDTPSAVQDVVGRIINIESGGRADAKNPKSSATGAGQFIDSTWIDMIRRHRPDLAEGRSRAQLLSLRTNKELSVEMTARYAEENAARIQAAGFRPTPGNIYLAHFLGPQGAIDMLRADPNANARDVNPAAAKSNPSIFSRRGSPRSAAQVVAWAEQKMGGASPAMEVRRPLQDPDPRFADVPLDKRLALLKESEAAYRSEIDRMASDHLASVLQFGPSSRAIPQAPSQAAFIDAYGMREGTQRHAQLQREVEVATKRHEFKTQTPAEIQASVASLKPVEGVTPPGQVAAQAQAYQAAQQAAQAELQARKEDPFGYVAQNNSHITDMWARAQQSGSARDISAAIDAAVAAQMALGIPPQDLAPLGSGVADAAVDLAKSDNMSVTQRMSQAVGLMAASDDPNIRAAIFEQLVEAGMPVETMSAFSAAMRGDMPAAERLFTAAITEVGKLPGDIGIKDSEIAQAVQDQIMAEGSIGDAVYGLVAGRQDTRRMAEADGVLMTKAIKLRVMQNGGDLTGAINGVARDIYGPVTVMNTSDATILIPEDEDRNTVLTGLRAFESEIEQALAAAVPELTEDDTAMMDAQERADVALLRRNLLRHARESVALGEWRNVGENSYGLYDRMTGNFFVDATGRIIEVSLADALERGESRLLEDERIFSDPLAIPPMITHPGLREIMGDD